MSSYLNRFARSVLVIRQIKLNSAEFVSRMFLTVVVEWLLVLVLLVQLQVLAVYPLSIPLIIRIKEYTQERANQNDRGLLLKVSMKQKK